jgi:hypothetical protein
VLGAKGEGENLEMPPLPLTAPVRAQLQAANGECWEAVYSQFIAKNQSDMLKARPDPTPCASATAPACSGECPVGQECIDGGSGCECESPGSPGRAFLDVTGGVVDWAAVGRPHGTTAPATAACERAVRRESDE